MCQFFETGQLRNVTFVCRAFKCSSSLHLDLWDIISVVGRSIDGTGLTCEF